MSDSKSSNIVPLPPPAAHKVTEARDERLDSWKEIATYLKRGVRTVQRWESEAGLPVHRLQHEKLGSVYAWGSELEAWWKSRGSQLDKRAGEDYASTLAIAVLPFADLSQEKDQQYFCEGIAEEIISRLTRVKAIRVVSRTSAFHVGALTSDLRELGRRLRVGTILEGSVRKAGALLRITVQLADVETGYQRWSGRFDREFSDIFAIQDEIARSVVESLEVDLTANERAALQILPTFNLRAYEYYLRGRQHYYQFGPKSMDSAVRLFLQAISLDPGFARAYAGLADCWCYIYLYSDRSETVREQAEWASRKALEMSPDSAHARASYGFSLSVSGRDAEAEEAFETAARLDPELFEAWYFYARHCFVRGRAQKAIGLYEAAMRVRPDDYQSPLLVAQIYDDCGLNEEAATARRRGIKLAEEHMKVNPEDARALYMTANGLVALGDTARGQVYAQRALDTRPDDPMLLYNVGCIYSMLGRCDDALECLSQAAARGLTQRGWYENDSNLAPLRTHPRFQQLLARLP
jgi:TolB-like protein/cytochrome c-type biogenesis protein CcmH/NrfG